MKPTTFMIIAGEASGDSLSAELVEALRVELGDIQGQPSRDYQPLTTSLEPRFFGAGGPRMAAAGVELAFDMTVHSVIGIWEVLKNLLKFRRLFEQLYQLALEREPDAIICVDFSGFNRRFAHAIRQYTRSRQGWFHDWSPKIIQYALPQIWASRPGRAFQMANDYDLLLSHFPFEKEWYTKLVPQLAVEFVGNPLVDRYSSHRETVKAPPPLPSSSPGVLLLPGSRRGELRRHLPVMIRALALIRASFPNLRARMVLPNHRLIQQAKTLGLPSFLEVQEGALAEALADADVSIASTGTVTTECALLGVPTVAMYRTSWFTWQVAKRVVYVKYGAMPNILADEEILPEFIQNAATPESIAEAALELLKDAPRRARVKARLAEVADSLGTPGASRRAAKAIVGLLVEGNSRAHGAPQVAGLAGIGH
jgi:lipid-A-disaccharide synthase